MAEQRVQTDTQTSDALTEGDLTKDSVVDELREEMAIIVSQDEMGSAENAYNSLRAFFASHPTFRNKQPRYYKAWQEILTQATWVLLPGLTQEQAVDLFRTSLPYALRNADYDLRRKLEALLIKQITLEARDELRGKLRKAMLTCEDDLTGSAIKREEQLVAGSVMNWIDDYNRFVGAGLDPTETLQKTEYFVRNQSFRALSKLDRDVVRRCIDLYEYLKLSSDNPLAFEMNIPAVVEGQEGVIRYGRFEPLDQHIIATYRMMLREIQALEEKGGVTQDAARDIRTEIGRSLAQHKELLTNIHRAEQELLRRTRAESAPLLDLLFDAQAAPLAKAGALMALARMSALDELFGDARAGLFMEQHVLIELKVEGADTAGLQQDFKNRGFTPEYRMEFLKYLLLSLTTREDDAAMIFQQMVNLVGGRMQQDLLPLYYYDVTQRQYRFRSGTWKEHKLVSA